MKILFSIFFLAFIPIIIAAQQCGNCKTTPSVAQYDLDVQVPQPQLKGEKTEGWLEWLQLFWYGKHANAQLFQQNKNCIRFTQPLSTEASVEALPDKNSIELTPLVDEQQILKVGQTYTNLPPSGDVSRFGDYLITGFVKPAGAGYIMHIELQTACSRKTVAFAEVPFQSSASSDYTMSIVQQALAKLSPLTEKIKQFELKEREKDDKVAFASMETDEIKIKPKKRNLGVGEQTELEITMQDCDGHPLGNREIVFTKGSIEGMAIPGTTGGTVTPERVITDAGGKAKATFKMGTAKSAMINAHHLHNKPIGCPYAKLGSFPIGSIPVKVVLSYFENESQTVRRGTLPGVYVEGGDETQSTNAAHTSIFYHFPSAAALKKGHIILVDDEHPEPDSKTEYIRDDGYYEYKKTETDAIIKAKLGNQTVVQDTEKGNNASFSALSNTKYHSTVMFTKGTANEPPMFVWNVLYPAQQDGEDFTIGLGMNINKGDEGVQWLENKITDPNGPYKTEYLITVKLDAAEELKKGNKAMKDLFGFNTDELTTAIDPTKPKKDMVTATGSRSITVRILSPYSEK